MDDQVMQNFLIKRAFLTPNRPAIYFEGVTYTFSEAYERAYKIARQLSGYGMKNDQYVSVLLSNHADTVFIYLGFHLLNVKAVILNNRLTISELAWQINNSKSAFLITEDKFSNTGKELENMTDIIRIEKEKLFESPMSDPIIAEEIHLNDVCTVMYTSGTTGHPKGVLQTYGNHWWSAIGSALNLGLSEQDCWLCAVPLFHISGYSILMKSIIYGMKIVILESFDEKKAIETIQNEKVTIMSVVSTMLVRIEAELKDDRLPSEFRCMLLGGGPASRTLLKQCIDKNIPVYQTYGMTETSSQIVTLSPEYSISKLGSAGKVLFPSQLKIVQPEGKEARPTEAGEILVKGPNVTSGYLNREEESTKKIVNGWLSTGDIGYVDEEGFLYVLDRRSDLIISGGENVYPAEIEGVLVSHPNISDAGVIGMKDNQWGEVPVAFVVTTAVLTEEEIREYSLKQLAKYKVPKKVLFIQEIPRNASKKILRRELRKLIDE
ncbi:o-succinylbenzoate--CoA ligase [Bacillus sp. S/N-304-OC-R1]|uniref:o-succinylbenzoate--CoA ligase n=1 Tax=Bacillus sp. S/N-304-OC-R1 TaxID=2758034 RepID=UPI001C8D2D93|nr:o-succinylbenzoate--CoA ligase [Bacillus sp. S/N-304-OC-R1]MBY0122860.1 o-succinylbenzoate--CoA ligase [Bacillus sp. S/N-304-OC-R1]